MPLVLEATEKMERDLPEYLSSETGKFKGVFKEFLSTMRFPIRCR